MTSDQMRCGRCSGSSSSGEESLYEEEKRERESVWVCERASAREMILSLQVFPETAAEVARSLD